MRKRQPLAVDYFLSLVASGYENDNFVRKEVVRIANRLREAKRFVLDEAASRYVGEMQRAVPQAIVHGQEFAIPPFDLMYVEYDALALWAGVTDTPPAIDADTRVGYLYDHGRVWVISGQIKGRERLLPLMPITYRLHKPMSIEEERTIVEDIGISRMGLDLFFCGSVYEQLDPDDRRAFRANHGMRFEIGTLMKQRTARELAPLLMHSCAGELRNIIAILLFLNRTSGVQFQRHVPAQPALIRRKPSAMVSHTVISFKLNPVPKIVEAFSSGGAWRRRHDVRGHFCHNDRARNSWCPTHDWSEYEPHRWRCLACGGLRWWRKEHKRGHEDKGITKTTYEVHA